MIPNAQNLVVAAIRNKRRLVIRYAGRSRSRTVEPHMLYHSEEGALTILCYQVDGYHSSKRQDSFWRPFQVKKIDNLVVEPEVFSPRLKEGFNEVHGLIRGTVLNRVVTEPDAYMHFTSEIYGPPTPAYLASSPSAMIRIATANGDRISR